MSTADTLNNVEPPSECSTATAVPTTSTPTKPPAPVKKFTSSNINKKFLASPSQPSAPKNASCPCNYILKVEQ